MKYMHIADCHLGGWREPKLQQLGIDSFRYVINQAINENVDFVLIAGDLFNTSIPSIDALKIAAEELNKLQQHNIPVYIIAGSHDYSPSGKTMIEVLHNAGLVTNVARGIVVNGKIQLEFTTDKKTGAKITGLLGKRGGLDKDYYRNLDHSYLEREQGYKIFMFHCAIDELKPEELQKMESMPVSLFPKKFDYYAGGHVHIIKDLSIPDYPYVVYPGPVFPNSFSELQKLHNGSYCIIDNHTMRREKIPTQSLTYIELDCKNKTPQQINTELTQEIQQHELNNHIVLLRLSGKLLSGKLTDITFKDHITAITNKGAYFIMKNTAGLTTSTFSEIRTSHNTITEIEQQIIKENTGQSITYPKEQEMQLMHDLIKTFSTTKHDGEKIHDYNERLKNEADQLLK